MNIVYYLAPSLATVEQYKLGLQAHDWSHEYSDDGTVWRRGRTELDWLRAVAKLLDPDSAIWNSIAPLDYRRKLT